MTKKIFLFYSLLAVLFTLPSLSFAKDDNAESSGFDINNVDIVKLIEADQALIAKQGYGNLIIPRELNKIPKSAFPADALSVCKTLNDAGFEAYLVGGAIRDMIMGRPADDFDVTTNATPDELQKLFGAKLRSHKTGKYTFFAVDMGKDHEAIDLANFQECPEEYIAAGYVKPIPSNTLLGDSFQRDLPFNAVYYQPSTGNIIDYHGGLADIRNKTINTMIDPYIQLSTDSRRIIRILRFQAKYDFALSATLDSCLTNHGAKFMESYPTNSLQVNLGKMFIGGYSVKCYNNMMKYNVFAHCFPPVNSIMNDESYKTYMMKQMCALDEKYNKGEKVKDAYAYAVILYPAYKALRVTKPQAEATETILTGEAKVMDMKPSLKKNLAKHLEKLYIEETSPTDK